MPLDSVERREALRRAFLPERVRVLFVGESPPASGAFFYAGDSALFRATRDAFCAAFGEGAGEPFLERFAACGCYLDDLCAEPVNRLRGLDAAKRRAAHRANEMRLAKTLAALRPDVIVVVMKSIAGSVARAAAAAGCESVERHTVTYPSRWHRHRLAYLEELSALIRNLADRGIIDLRRASSLGDGRGFQNCRA
jgi:hypothetical protein